MTTDAQPSLTTSELAHRLGGTLHGNPDQKITGVAPLNEAGPEDASWLGDPRYLRHLADSRAGVVLIPQNADTPTGRTVIKVPDPDLAVSLTLGYLAPPQEPVPPGVDPSARVAADALVDGACIGPFVYVGPRAVIGPGTQVHSGVYLGADCRIGRNCVLWPNAVVRERSTLGDRVVLHANVTVGADGFGYHYRDGRHHKIPQIGRVVIEDDVEIGANTCVDRARSGLTRIGRGTKIDNLVQIGHNVRIGEDCIIVSQCGISGSTTLGHHVVLAGQVGLIDHLRIGNGAVVAAKSGVAEDIPDGKVYRGIPAVENADFGRQMVGVRRLPKIMEQLKALTKRVEQLESPADHSARD